MRWRRAVLGPVIALALVLAVPTAHAGITAAGCIADDASTSIPCASSAPGLDGAGGVAVSPDGRSVYTGSVYDSALDAFTRDAATGAPTFQTCWLTANPLFPPDCGPNRAEGLGFAGAVAVTADGRNLYVGGGVGNAVVAFSRDASGSPSYLGCVSDPAPTNGETNACGGVNQEGLESVVGVAVPRDGENVYAVGANTGALVALDRNTATGALTPAGCFKSPGAGLVGADATCAGSAPGMQGPLGITASPDGRNLYVASRDSGAVSVFWRSSVPGHALTPAGCLAAATTGFGGLATGCTTIVPSLARARQVAVSPDGKTVTVASDTGTMTVLARDDTTGALSFRGCLAGAGGGGVCGTYPGAGGAASFGGAGTMAISPDGRDVYVGAGVNFSAVLVYARDTTTGILTYVECVRDASLTGSSCTKVANGIRTPNDVAVSPDGHTVYVAAGNPFASDHFGSLAWFTRTADAPPPPPKPSVTVAPLALNAAGKLVGTVLCPTGATEFCTADLSVSRAARAAAGATGVSQRLATHTVKGRARVSVKLPRALRRARRIRVTLARINPNGSRTTVRRTLRLRRSRG